VAESESLQIITQIFIDDVEETLRNRYNATVSLGTPKETESDKVLLKEYILQKLKIEVNGAPVTLNYLGREYDMDMVKAYIEVTGIRSVNSIAIENKILMDQYDEQQNIIHFKTQKRRKSLILDRDNPKGMLNFH
jgi:SUMO ligase MMS21 Smc5/6 complex component